MEQSIDRTDVLDEKETTYRRRVWDLNAMNNNIRNNSTSLQLWSLFFNLLKLIITQ